MAAAMAHRVDFFRHAIAFSHFPEGGKETRLISRASFGPNLRSREPLRKPKNRAASPLPTRPLSRPLYWRRRAWAAAIGHTSDSELFVSSLKNEMLLRFVSLSMNI